MTGRKPSWTAASRYADVTLARSVGGVVGAVSETIGGSQEFSGEIGLGRIAPGFTMVVIRFQTLMIVAMSAATRPWRLRGVPTPITERMSSPRLKPLACTMSRL